MLSVHSVAYGGIGGWRWTRRRMTFSLRMKNLSHVLAAERSDEVGCAASSSALKECEGTAFEVEEPS